RVERAFQLLHQIGASSRHLGEASRIRPARAVGSEPFSPGFIRGANDENVETFLFRVGFYEASPMRLEKALEKEPLFVGARLQAIKDSCKEWDRGVQINMDR